MTLLFTHFILLFLLFSFAKGKESRKIFSSSQEFNFLSQKSKISSDQLESANNRANQIDGVIDSYSNVDSENGNKSKLDSFKLSNSFSQEDSNQLGFTEEHSKIPEFEYSSKPEGGSSKNKSLRKEIMEIRKPRSSKNSGDLKQLRANIKNLQNRLRALGQKPNKPIIQKLDQSSKSSILNNSYSVKKITFKYGGSPGGLPNLNLLTRVELLLSFSNKLISLGDLIIGKSERFNLSLKDFNILSEVPLQYLKSFGYEGVVVFPSPNDIDPVSGADLRTGGDDNLTFVIWVSKLKTISVDAAKIKKSKKVVSRINELSESYLQEKSSKSNFLKQEDIRYLRRWGASPSRNAQVSLSPGKKAGDVNATIKLEPLKSNKVAIQTANSGSSATGEWIFDLSAVNHQLTGADDQLGVMLSSSQTFERQSLVAFYKRPIIYPNLLEFGASIGHSKYDASAFALTQFDFQGETSAADLQLSWKPLTTEKDAWSIGFDSGLRLENVKASNSLISDFADTYVLSPNLIFRINTRATYLKTQSSISLVGNILAIDQSDQGALGGVNTNEKYVRLNFSYLESLHLGKWLVDTFPNSFGKGWAGQEIVTKVQFSLGLSGDRHLPMHQFVLGGTGSVRGYPESPVAGDDGFLISTEYRIPLYRSSSFKAILSPFIDWGQSYVNQPYFYESNHNLLGTGIGLEFQLPLGLYARIDFAKPLHELSTVNGVIDGTNAGDYRIHTLIRADF